MSNQKQQTKHSHNILVTGGAGYVGSHICKALHLKGFTPIVIDDFSQGHPEIVKWGPAYEGCIGNRTLLEEVLLSQRPLGVIHCAGATTVGESVQDPLKYYEQNVIQTIEMLKLLNTHQIAFFLFSSSCAIYGEAQEIPLREDHPKNPESPYGRTKWMVEQILEDLSNSSSMRYTCLRYFNAAGADMDGEIGENHNPETHLIPRIFDAIMGVTPPLEIYGNDYPTLDGTAVRDYIHVDDLARAHVLAFERLMRNAHSISLNLGTGRGYSVLEIIQTVERITGEKVPYSMAPKRAGDPPRLIADPSFAQNELNWRAEVSDLETIIRSAWSWHQQLRKATAPV
ncbi:MAG: UDP-glucose 4-epimerase GalE [Chlamydiia bacterium]|nr:UDP-glucose 4-epimerase GalE [Chlamydiia bacterium]